MMYNLVDLLSLDEKDIWQYKLEFNMKNGKYGEPYLERWLRLSREKKESGEDQDISYWGWASLKGNGRKNYHIGSKSLSFVQISTEKWLFVSAAEIKDIPWNNRCEVEIIEKLKPLFGRLIIKFKKGNKMGRYVFNAADRINECEVYAILPNLYGSTRFPGYEHVVNIKMAELKNYIDNDSLGEDWRNKLRAVKAVYCLNDHCDHKTYIGSAYNDSNGLMGRWEDYLSIYHGNNKDLKILFNKKGEQYFLDNFYFSILETFPLNYKDDDIIKREHEWMQIFNSTDKDSGYNN